MNDKIKEMEIADLKQWEYLKKAIPQIKTWAKINRCRIYRIECVPIFGEALGILIFYKTEKLLKKYRENGVIKMTEDEIVNILSDIGYMKEFNNNIRISFDSDENVRKNYQGNYGLRLTDD